MEEKNKYFILNKRLINLSNEFAKKFLVWVQSPKSSQEFIDWIYTKLSAVTIAGGLNRTP